MHRLPHVLRYPFRLLLLLAVIAVAQPDGLAAQDPPGLRIENRGMSDAEANEVFADLDPARMPADLLVDQVATLVDPELFDGSERAPAASLRAWRQLYHQLSRSGVGPGTRPHPRGGRMAQGLPSIDRINEIAEEHLERGRLPIALVNVPYARIAPDAFDQGLLELEGNRLRQAGSRGRSPYRRGRAFAAAAFTERTVERSVDFVIPRELIFDRGNGRGSRLTVDFDDGRGPRRVRAGDVIPVTYDSGGEKQISLTSQTGGDTFTALTTLEVSSTIIPSPDLVWSNQVAQRHYAAGFGGYDAYFFLGSGNTVPTRPVVFVEGFDPYYDDPAKRRTWEDIYDILLQQNFISQLRARGYDAVIMKLDNATDYVQRNAFALEHLLAQLEVHLGRETDVDAHALDHLGRKAHEGGPHGVGARLDVQNAVVPLDVRRRALRGALDDHVHAGQRLSGNILHMAVDRSLLSQRSRCTRQRQDDDHHHPWRVRDDAIEPPKNVHREGAEKEAGSRNRR